MRGLPGITRIFTIRTALDIFKRPNQTRFLSDNIYHSVHSPSSESYQTFHEKKILIIVLSSRGGRITTSYIQNLKSCVSQVVRCQMKRLRSPHCVDLLFFFWIVSLIKPLYLSSVLSLSPDQPHCSGPIVKWKYCIQFVAGWNSVKIPHFTAVNPISQC